MEMSSSNGQRTYRCGTCDRTFARLEHLQRHTRTHTKEKPFTCFCGRSFARNDLLKRHKQHSHTSIVSANQVPSRETLQASGHVEVGEFAPSGPNAYASGPPISVQHEESTNVHNGLNHDPLQDFGAFLDGIGLAPDWDSLDFLDFTNTPGRTDLTDQQQSVSEPTIQDVAIQTSSVTVHRGITHESTSASNVATAALANHPPDPIQWKLTEKQWNALSTKVESCRDLLPNFVMPSRHALSRYFQSYVDQFHKHYPILHLATYVAETPPICLTLSIAAVGAQYRFERKNGEPLYQAARLLTLAQRQQDNELRGHGILEERRIVMIQVLVLLMVYGAWDWKIELLSGALDLQSMLADYIRLDNHVETQSNDAALDWLSWIRDETHRRASLIAFAYLNVQSITYDLPPVIMSSEVENLCLPCGSTAWEAKDAQEWTDACTRSDHTPVRVVDAMSHFLGQADPNESDRSLRLSAVGSFIILQALIQRAHLVRQLKTRQDAELAQSDLMIMQRALSRWKAIWQRTPDSSLDPRNAEGPIPFTSAAFLALAFARLHINLGPHRQLRRRDATFTAKALLATPIPRCSPEIIPALLHAAHALNVPVMMGVDYVSGSQMFFWSYQHSLCGFESGVFLWRWLQSAGHTCTWQDLTSDEKGVVSWVRFSVSETLQSVGPVALGLPDDVVVADLSFPKLGILVLKIWARIFSDNTMWAFTHEIGESLRLLAAMVEDAD